MESDINFLLDGMCKAAKIPKSLRNVKLDIKREKEWNKFIESLNKKFRTED
jgi:hypothetical protein